MTSRDSIGREGVPYDQGAAGRSGLPLQPFPQEEQDDLCAPTSSAPETRRNFRQIDEARAVLCSDDASVPEMIAAAQFLKSSGGPDAAAALEEGMNRPGALRTCSNEARDVSARIGQRAAAQALLEIEPLRVIAIAQSVASDEGVRLTAIRAIGHDTSDPSRALTLLPPLLQEKQGTVTKEVLDALRVALTRKATQEVATDITPVLRSLVQYLSTAPDRRVEYIEPAIRLVSEFRTLEIEKELLATLAARPPLLAGAVAALALKGSENPEVDRGFAECLKDPRQEPRMCAVILSVARADSPQIATACAEIVVSASYGRWMEAAIYLKRRGLTPESAQAFCDAAARPTQSREVLYWMREHLDPVHFGQGNVLGKRLLHPGIGNSVILGARAFFEVIRTNLSGTTRTLRAELAIKATEIEPELKVRAESLRALLSRRDASLRGKAAAVIGPQDPRARKVLLKVLCDPDKMKRYHNPAFQDCIRALSREPGNDISAALWKVIPHLTQYYERSEFGSLLRVRLGLIEDHYLAGKIEESLRANTASPSEREIALMVAGSPAVRDRYPGIDQAVRALAAATASPLQGRAAAVLRAGSPQPQPEGK